MLQDPNPIDADAGHGINSLAESNKGKRIFKTCLDYSHGSPDRNRAIADSYLVAAAPDLLQSLREMVAGFSFAAQNPIAVMVIERANAAIAKAEGKQ